MKIRHIMPGMDESTRCQAKKHVDVDCPRFLVKGDKDQHVMHNLYKSVQ